MNNLSDERDYLATRRKTLLTETDLNNHFEKIVADAYKKYKYDVSNLAVPLDRPKSTYHNNALFFKGFF